VNIRKLFWRSTLYPADQNHFLDVRNNYYAENRNGKKKCLSSFDTIRMLTSMKKEMTWLNEINS